MSNEELLFTTIGMQIESGAKGNLFSKPCFKIDKKTYKCFFQNEMVFKLIGEMHSEALSLDGSQLFNPSGKNKPMRQWAKVPFDYKDLWVKFAIRYVLFVVVT